MLEVKIDHPEVFGLRFYYLFLHYPYHLDGIVHQRNLPESVPEKETGQAQLRGEVAWPTLE